MKTYCTSFAGLLGSLLLASCAPAADGADPQIDEAAALSSTRDSYLLVRRDARDCAQPACGGYFVRELNRSSSVAYASEMRVAIAGTNVTDEVMGAPDDELIVRGHVSEGSPTTLVVSEAYRAMPGASIGSAAQFFTVTLGDCMADDCLPPVVRLVNQDGASTVGDVNIGEATQAWVDSEWLKRRVMAHGAIVAGTITVDARGSLDVSQVFVRLPDHVGPCPLTPPPVCDAATVPVFERDANRCLVPTGCSHRGVCQMYLPRCASGYTLHSWTSGTSACLSYACDPSFLSSE
jgi:hypothetical protein